jgi:hypothetical protein
MNDFFSCWLQCNCVAAVASLTEVPCPCPDHSPPADAVFDLLLLQLNTSSLPPWAPSCSTARGLVTTASENSEPLAGEFPTADHRQRVNGGCASRPAQVRQAPSQAFEGRRRGFLAYALPPRFPDPPPSGSAGASRLRQSRLPPTRHLPRQAALSPRSPAATEPRSRSSTPTPSTTDSRRTPFVTSSVEPTVGADLSHRRHALVETVFGDLTHVPLTHLPLSQLSANSAWVVCAMITHSLLRAAALDPHQPAVHAAPISAAEPSTFQYAWPDHNDASYCPSQPTGPGRQVAGDLDRHHEPCSGVPLAP